MGLRDIKTEVGFYMKPLKAAGRKLDMPSKEGYQEASENCDVQLPVIVN